MVECFNELIRACYDFSYPYDVIMCKCCLDPSVKSRHGEEMYVFVRRYQKSLDTIRVNVRLSAATHS